MSTYKALKAHAKNLFANNDISKEIYDKMIHQIDGLENALKRDKDQGILYRTRYELRSPGKNGVITLPQKTSFQELIDVILKEKLGMLSKAELKRLENEIEIVCIRTKSVKGNEILLSELTVPLKSVANIELLQNSKNTNIVKEPNLEYEMVR